MRELGPKSDELHAGLAPMLIDAHIDELVLVGAETRPLENAVRDGMNVTRADDAEQAAQAVLGMLRPGDAILVKASNSVGLSRVVERLTKGLAECSI
jgi:UDP-N-acetylmuramoyl-tripeptide--D-alanyl-D-alanine ligase